MVVKGLLSYLRSSPSCKVTLSLRRMASALQESCGNKADIVCDAVPVLLWLYGKLDTALTEEGRLPSYSCIYGGDYRMYAERLAAFVRALRHLEIEPVFFFPAAPGCDKAVFPLTLPVLKASYRDFFDKVTLIQQICAGSGDCWRMSRSLHPLMLLQSKMTLTLLKAKMVQCVGNNLTEMAAYKSSNSNVIGILSTNSDLAVVTGSTFMDTCDFDLDNALHLSSPFLNDKPADVLCSLVTPQALAHAIRIKTDQLAHLAIICGNDYTRELNQALGLCEHLQLKDLTIASVAEWISKNETDLLGLFPEISRYTEAVVQSYTLYSGDYHLPSPSPESMCQYLLSRIKAGKMLNSTPYAVASSAVYVRQIVVESSVCSVSQPCAEELLLPLRKLQYALLGVASVSEYGYSSQGPVLDFTENRVTVTTNLRPRLLLQTIHSAPIYTQILFFFHLIRSIKHESTTALIWQECETIHHVNLDEASLKGVLTFTSIALFMILMGSGNSINKFFSDEEDAILVTLLLCHSGFPLYWSTCSPFISSVSASMCFSHLLDMLYNMASLIGLQSCLPEPKDFFYPMVCIPFLLASTRHIGVSADITAAKQTLEHVLHLPSVATLRNACSSFFNEKHASLEKALKLYHAAMSDLSCYMVSILPVGKLPNIGGFGTRAPPGFTSPVIHLPPDKKKRDLPARPPAPAPLSSEQPVTTSLPITEYKQTILDLIEHNRVVCLTGEAGCGKSTMVPQFILDNHLSTSSHSHKACRVLVSQPRRVAAIKLAQYVSETRGEKCGLTIGYNIGGKRVSSSECKIVYCTCGYLLELLIHTPDAIKNYSHIILDEIHERDVNTDFLLLVVRMMAVEVAPMLKIVLMSATMQGGLLVHYFIKVFGKEQVSEPLSVGLKRHPVEEIFIDDIKESLCHGENECFCDVQQEAYLRLKVLANKEARSVFSSMEWTSAQPMITTYAQEVCTELIVTQSMLGTSVLVFFPGIVEITEYYDMLIAELHARNMKWLFQVFVLHSLVPLDDQQGLFELPPRNMVNIILATDVAESSITLPALRIVINFGIRHVPRYDYKTKVTHLVKKWCSRASCSQRAGRVGRVCKGLAVHLFPQKFYEQVLSDHEPPEMFSLSLSKLVLQAHRICQCLEVTRPTEFLGELLEPPSLQSLQEALYELVEMGAIVSPADQKVSDVNMKLTLLGRLVLKLPLNLKLSRMILLSLHFGCAVEGIVIAASLSLQNSSLFCMPAYSISNTSENEPHCLDLLRKCIDSQFLFDRGLFSDLIQVCPLLEEWWLFLGAHQISRAKAAKKFQEKYGVSSLQLLRFENKVAEIASRTLELLPVGSSVYINVSKLVSVGWKVNSQDNWECPTLQYCEDVNVIRALLVASFIEGVLCGIRMLDCRKNYFKIGSQSSAAAITASGFNPSATLVWPSLVEHSILTEFVSSTLGSSAQFKTCVVNSVGEVEFEVPQLQKHQEESPMKKKSLVGLVEFGGIHLKTQQAASQQWWDDKSLVNSPISEVKELVLLRMHSVNKARWSKKTGVRKYTRLSHSHRVVWYSLHNIDKQINLPCMSSRASILCDFASSPSPLFAVTSFIGCQNDDFHYSRDLTVLPCLQRSKLAILFLLAFLPCTYTILQLVDHQAKVVRAITVNNTKIEFGQWQNITVFDLLVVNRLRLAMSSLIMTTTDTASVVAEKNLDSIQKFLDNLLHQSDNPKPETTLDDISSNVQVDNQLYYRPLKCSLLNDAVQQESVSKLRSPCELHLP